MVISSEGAANATRRKSFGYKGGVSGSYGATISGRSERGQSGDV